MKTLILILALTTTHYTITWEPYALTYERTQGRPLHRDVTIGVFRSEHPAGPWELVGESADTSLVDSLAYADQRTFYVVKARWTTGTAWTGPSKLLSGATLDFRQGVENFRRTKTWKPGEGLRHLLVVYYPAGLWISSWSPRRPEIEVAECFIARYVYDVNGNGILDLSDFSAFAQKPHTEEELDQFFAMYNKTTIFWIVFPE